MFIRYLDYLSPRVTFYHKGFLSHNSIVSGILSAIALVFIIILVVYFSLEIIQRKNPNSFYFHSFAKDAGNFRIDTSSLFHFISSTVNNQGKTINEDFDYTIFNIIGVNIYYKNFLTFQKRSGLKFIEHWIYGPCNKEINTKGLDDLLVYDFFEKSSCIKKYYSTKEEKYIDIGDPKFVWPEIAHGTFNEENILYNILIQKCNNDTLREILGEGYTCKNENEIDSYFNIRGSRIFHFYFVNNYINLLNYQEPNFKFFYRIESPLYKDQYSTNDLNIDPALIKTNNGLVLEHIEEEISYIFERNDVYIGSNEGQDIYMVYCFFLKNMMEYYQRTYKRIQDVISNIGGINQAITIIAVYLNNFYNSFIVLYDTELLLNSSIHLEKKIHKKKSAQYLNLKKIKELEKLNKNNENKRTSDRRKNSPERDKKNKSENDITLNNNMSKSNNNFLTEVETSKKLKGEKSFLSNMRQSDIEKFQNITTLLTMREFKYKKTFWDYICYKVSCGKNKSFFKIYENFRTKIISEEHLIRNHINIYNLLKVTERKRHSRRNSYQLKDLINLI